MTKQSKLVFACTGLIVSIVLGCTMHSQAARDGEQSTEVNPTQVQQPEPSVKDRVRWCEQAKREIFNKCEKKKYDQIQDKLSDLLTPAAKRAQEAPGGQQRFNKGIELLDRLVHSHYRTPQNSEEKKAELETLLQEATTACTECDQMESAPFEIAYTGEVSERGTNHFIDCLQKHVDGVELTGVGASAGFVGLVGGGVGAGHSSDPCGNKHRTVGAASTLGMGGGVSAKIGQHNTLRTEEDGRYHHDVDSQMLMNVGAGPAITLPLATEVGAHYNGNGTVGIGVGAGMGIQGTHTKTADLWPLPKFFYGRDFDFMRMCAQITPDYACLPEEVGNKILNFSNPATEEVRSEKEAETLVKEFIKNHK